MRIGRLSLFISSVVTLGALAFFVLRPAVAPQSGPDDDLVYRHPNLGFSLPIPHDWAGRYSVIEEYRRNIRKISFDYIGVPDRSVEIFSILAYPENVELKIADIKEIKRSNGIVYAWQDGSEKQFDGYEQEAFMKMKNQAQGMIGKFFLTGEYQSRTAEIFFSPGGVSDCSAVTPVGRVLDYGVNYEEMALRELFSGPNEDDRIKGYVSQFSDKTKDILENIVIKDRTAYVNLRDFREIIPGANSSCGGSQFMAQIERTLIGFPGVDSVVIAINKSPSIFYEWMQIGCTEHDCDDRPFLSF